MIKIPNLTVRLFNEHIKPCLPQFLIASGFMILSALSTAALPYLLQPVFDDVLSGRHLGNLFFFCGAVFLAFLGKGIGGYGESVVMTHVGQRLISDLQKRLFSHLVQLDIAFYHSTTTGALMSALTHDITLMRQAMANTLLGLGRDSITLVCLIAVMVYRDPLLTFLALGVFPIAVFPVMKLGKRMRKVTASTQQEVAQLNTHLTQVFQNIRVVKAYTQEKFEILQTSKLIDQIFKLIYKAAKVRSASHPIMEFLAGIAIVSVIAYGGYQVMHGNRTTGEFISFIGALLLIYEPLKRLSQLNTNVQEGLAAADRVFRLLDQQPTIASPLSLKKIEKAHGHIVFENVSFRYSDNQPLLKDFSLNLHPGQSIAFVGPSGAGKSTLINLIPRFYDVLSGSLQIDGINVKDWNLQDLRKQIGLVSQEVALFDGTIQENIEYGLEEATFDQIQEAAEKAYAHDFIESLPLGYQTPIGENGIKLSGGQRQRIVIARAILKNAPILLLDEATSALDMHSEGQVQLALKELMHSRTTISVAHRLATIIDCDCIYVFDKGRIIEEGTHKDLLKEKGLYWILWNQQSFETSKKEEYEDDSR